MEAADTARFDVAVHETGKFAKVKIGEFECIVDAQSVSTMIRELATARARMLPEIASDVPSPNEWTSSPVEYFEARVSTEHGALALVLRDPGLGWVAYLFALGDAKRLPGLLADVLAGRPASMPMTAH